MGWLQLVLLSLAGILKVNNRQRNKVRDDVKGGNIVRIAVSKGHNVYNNNIFDNGASGNGKREAYEVDKTIDALIPMLRNQGHYVVDVTPKNEHFKNSKAAHEERAKRVNKGNFDIYLDVHLNAGGGTGTEMWVYAPRGLSYDYAREIVNNIVSDTGLRNRGVKVKPTMWSLSMTNCPSIIVEGGFIDSKKDMDIITPELYARSIAKAFGEVPGVVKPTDEIYRVRKSWEDTKSQMGAYSKLDNAIVLAKKLNLTVYDSKGAQIYPELEEVEPIKYTRLIKIGARGEDVRLLQTYLNKLGYNSGVPDGIAGANTDKAIKHFQRANGLVVDGLAGKATIDKINQLMQGGEVEMVKPQAPTNRKSKYYKIGDAHIIETTPNNIYIDVLGNNLHNANAYGVNGTFYDTGTAPVTSPNSCVFIAMNNGKAISNNAQFNGWNAPPRATMIYHTSGLLGFRQLQNISTIRNITNWAIGGFMVKPYMSFANEKIPGSINYKTAHTYIGYNANGKVYLIVKPYHMINEIVPLLNQLKIINCIVVDGGGSSQLNHPDGNFRASRRINTAILLKEV